MTTPRHDIRRECRLSAGRLCALGMVALAGCGGDSASDGSRPDLFTLERGPLPITISESAELRASKEERIKSEVEGQATIIYLIEEGAQVEEGDRLVELDVSDLVDRKANQEISVERASAALVNAEQDMEILEKEIRAEEAEAASKLEIAKIDVEKFLGRDPRDASEVVGDVIQAAPTAPGAGPNGDGDPRGTNRDMVEALRKQVEGTEYEHLVDQIVAITGPSALDFDMGELAQQVLRQIDEIALADQQWALNKDKYEKSLPLAAKNYITKNKLEETKLAFKRSESQVTLAWNELDLLIGYSLRKEKIDLQLKLDNADLLLDKTRASANAKRARGEAELSSQQKEHKLATERLENLATQIENAVIRAPSVGLVVYATQGDGRRGRETVEEGLSVRDRQTLIILPDLRNMLAELKVQEADVNKVVAGQKAVITVDTFPDRVFSGRVTRVSPLPDSGSRWTNNNLKVYKTWVSIEGVNRELRPNMNARVEILVGRKDDVLAVPLSAVRRERAVHYVWKQTADGPVAQRVEIGVNNVSHVEIVEGLAEGDQVYLAPPQGADAPEYEQPPRPQADTEIPDPNQPRRPRTADAGMTMARFQALLAQKLPAYADEIEEGGMAIFRNADLRAAIENDPELAAASAALMSQMRNRRPGGEGGPGEGRRGGRNRGEGGRTRGEGGRSRGEGGRGPSGRRGSGERRNG